MFLPGWSQLLSILRLAHPRLAILIRTYRGYFKELNGAEAESGSHGNVVPSVFKLHYWNSTADDLQLRMVTVAR